MATSDKRLISGFLWNLGEKLLIQVIAFIVGIILARKLGPEVYGLVAIVSIIISLLTVATNLYTGTYLMRKKEIDSLDLNTCFYFTLFVNIFIYLVLFLVAPLLATFYGKPELTSLLRVIGISVVISSFLGIKLVLVVRNYDYKKYFWASLFGTLVAGATGIALAYLGFGAWALAAQHCLDGVIDAIILWLVIKWNPKFEFSFKRLKEMLKYGLPLWMFGIVDSFSTRLQQLVIGKKYTSSDLAYYNRGESFPSIIESNSTSALNNVLLRKVSEEQDKIQNVGKILRKITRICLYISIPSMFGLASVATTTIKLLLGDEWIPSVYFLQVFCIAFALKPFEVTSDVALKAVGRTKQFFVFGLIKRAFLIIAVFCTVPFGVKAIAIGFLVASIFAYITSLIVNSRYFKISLFHQLFDAFLPLLVSFIMWIIVAKIGSIMLGIKSIIILLIQLICGVLFYVISIFMLDKNTIVSAKNLIVSFIGKGDKKNDKQ